MNADFSFDRVAAVLNVDAQETNDQCKKAKMPAGLTSSRDRTKRSSLLASSPLFHLIQNYCMVTFIERIKHWTCIVTIRSPPWGWHLLRHAIAPLSAGPASCRGACFIYRFSTSVPKPCNTFTVAFTVLQRPYISKQERGTPLLIHGLPAFAGVIGALHLLRANPMPLWR